jgi:hypothetical protein
MHFDKIDRLVELKLKQGRVVIIILFLKHQK